MRWTADALNTAKIFDPLIKARSRCLSRYQCNQLEAGIDNNLVSTPAERPPEQRAQVIAGAALFARPFSRVTSSPRNKHKIALLPPGSAAAQARRSAFAKVDSPAAVRPNTRRQ